MTEGKILVCFACPHLHPLRAPSERKCFETEVGMCVLLEGLGSFFTGALLVFS